MLLFLCLNILGIRLALGTCPASAEGDHACRDEVVYLQSNVRLHSQSPSAAIAAKRRGGAPNCASHLGVFGDGPLLNTQLMPEELRQRPLNFTMYSDQWYADPSSPLDQIMMASPEKRFAMCLISTHGIPTAWRMMLSKVYSGDVSLSVDPGNTHSFSNDYIPPRSTPAELQQVFFDPTATRVALTREPVARFRAAFFEKCNKTEVDDACPILPPGSDGRNLTMQDAVEWFLMQDPTRLETHWLLQSEFCELRDRVAEYTIITRYSFDLMSKENNCIMDIAGLSEFNNLGIGSEEASFWDSFVDLDEAVSTDLQETRLLQKLFPPEAALRLIQHLQQDYQTFNYPRVPAWLEGATGELYRQSLMLIGE
mmetsp:Transcript_86573/g.218017  ORF Transcript_86573/g.218017 Transcript_86573/m.218017 type:complete len:368 (-) Transcript_86573:160-1263(-)